MTRVAVVLACEDVRIEYDGKLTAVGIFTSSIAIPAPIVVPKMAFIIHFEGSADDPLQSLSIEINFPGVEPPKKLDIPIAPTPNVEGQKGWKYLIPLHLANVSLNPGRIFLRIIHERGAIEAGAGLIVIGHAPTWPVLNGEPLDRTIETTSSNEPEPLGVQSPPDAPQAN
jgi:hypothetical protein